MKLFDNLDDADHVKAVAKLIGGRIIVGDAGGVINIVKGSITQEKGGAIVLATSARFKQE